MTTLTLWGHSCVRFDGEAGALVIDPGVYSDLEHALDGAHGVLVTHEHPDHLAVDALAPRIGAALPLWGTAGAVDALVAAGADPEHVHVVHAGDELDVAGLHVQVTGEWHALIHRDVPLVHNVGYLVEGRALHPGDAFVVPDGIDVDVLLTPVAGPWLRLADAVDFVRAVAPRRLVPVHDAMLSEIGRGATDGFLARLAGQPVRLDVGESLTLAD
ncbi:MBL fold metallo-hydrolase [Cellulomonas soli]|uniref:MBL fold metallo-hydrolase n=1 Tax=Cellulomonas soli TaxID=931535 RepID=A0A512PAE2_9CELL|nr:MBL fold metallo-hydrolase [Cellulomonas soli]NYI60658.1 L-ascorbate metabolism protein UlaG (beta-lactamase superfamily) [Cellulomonas soli]GEP68173.1 MBL fold metallo-hydrolase [Cellulomonas soli]